MHQGGFYLLPFAVGASIAAALSLLGVGALLARSCSSRPRRSS